MMLNSLNAGTGDIWTVPEQPAYVNPRPWHLNNKDVESEDDEGNIADPVRAILECEFSTRSSERSQLFKKLDERLSSARETAYKVNRRIEFLRLEAKSDGDSFNDASRRDLDLFRLEHPLLRRPRLFLLESGNLRAVWKGTGGQHLGLQFLGGKQVQFVIFSKRTGATEISRVAGKDSFEGISRQIAVFELEGLLYT